MSSRPVVSRRDFLTLGRSLAGASGAQVHIASLLVHAKPEHLEEILATVRTFAGAELHATQHPAKLVVVLESAEEHAIGRCVDALHAAPGVLTVSIVSHLIEDAAALDEDFIDDSEPPSVSEA
jgi:periplasmic nitrate reductase NapD